jgi:ACS family sodium-dependent inorganic phosphate cotransporter
MMIDATVGAIQGTKRHIQQRYVFVVLAFFGTLITLIDRVNLSVVAPVLSKEQRWTPVILGTVLSAFFWGYAISPIPGGWLADRFGGKRVVGFGAIWWSLCTFLTPLGRGAAGIMAFRFLLGLGEGVNSPGLQSLVARWIPVKERTRAVTLYLTGGPLGTIVALPLSTWIIANWGWRAVFYISAALGLVWVLFWFLATADSPETHRRISEVERSYIIAHRSLPDRTSTVPWARLMTSAPVWALIIMTFSVAWVVWLFISWLPTYLIQAHGFSLKQSGFYSALPFVANVIGGVVAGWVQDKAIARGYAITRVRKVTLTVSSLSAAALLLLVPGTSQAIYAVWYITAMMAIFAATQGTVMVNNLDIAPRHAGVILGIQATAGNAAGAISPIVAGLVVQRTGSYNGVFYLIAALLFVTVVIWNLFASGERVVD